VHIIFTAVHLGRGTSIVATQSQEEIETNNTQLDKSIFLIIDPWERKTEQLLPFETDPSLGERIFCLWGLLLFRFDNMI